MSHELEEIRWTVGVETLRADGDAAGLAPIELHGGHPTTVVCIRAGGHCYRASGRTALRIRVNRMALLHRAELRPSKIELLDGWVSAQPWFEGDASAGLSNVASFRFDDPEGEVGVETLLVRAGDGPILQIPLTYRNAQLAGADAWLIGTMQHSVLGKRWVYDAVGDPVYLLTVASAAVAGGRQAELFVEIDGELVQRKPTAPVVGSGTSGAPILLPSVDDVAVRNEDGLTVVETTSLQLVILRVPGGPAQHRPASLSGAVTAEGTLTGTWAGQSEPQPLVLAFTR